MSSSSTYQLSQDRDTIPALQNSIQASHRDGKIVKEVPFKVQIIQEFAIGMFFIIGVLNLYSMRRKDSRSVQKQKKTQNNSSSTDCEMQKLNDSRDNIDDDYLFSNLDYLFSERT